MTRGDAEAKREADELFDAALQRFKEAATALCEAWSAERPDEVPDVSGYPAYLPSFDEFALEVLGIERVKR